ncbi:MAG: GNAT family N-acetyltransferase [Clostridium sp.]|nr:GNAT family N-acetyltransferase [Clostridium sp.]
MIIKTKRLFIREMKAEDWKDMKNIAIDFAQSEYIIYDQPFPLEDIKVMELTKRFADSHLFFAVFLEDTSDMIGYVCFYNNDGNYDLGYCFHSDYKGNGYAFESCLEVIKYMEHNHKVKSFTAGTALKNIPSCNLLKKLGFVLSKTETLAFHKDENGFDIAFEGGHFIRLNK